MRKKVLFVLPSFKAGGAERVILNLLKKINRSKFDVHLVLISDHGQYIDELPKDIKLYSFNLKRVGESGIPILKLIRDLRPDTVISTLGHLNILLCILKPFFPKKTRLIIREGSIASINLNNFNATRLWSYLYKIFYKKADKIICQSNYMLKDLNVNFNIPSNKMVKIYNPVNVLEIRNQSLAEGNPYPPGNDNNILFVGRLSPEKGIERLIFSFKEYYIKDPKAKLWIIGNGPLKENLKGICVDNGLSESVVFMDFQKNPYKWMRFAHLFVLPSYYEGLPNALLEAIACSCPVAVLAHPGGTLEIMHETKQENRFLDRMEWHQFIFQRPGNDILDSLIKEFNADKIVKEYESIL